MGCDKKGAGDLKLWTEWHIICLEPATVTDNFDSSNGVCRGLKCLETKIRLQAENCLKGKSNTFLL